MTVSIPLIGSNLFKLMQNYLKVQNLSLVSIPFIGSNLFKFIDENKQKEIDDDSFNPLDRVKFV